MTAESKIVEIKNENQDEAESKIPDFLSIIISQ